MYYDIEPNQCIKMAFGSSPHCVMIWNDSILALCHNFWHCEIFSKIFLLQGRPRV